MGPVFREFRYAVRSLARTPGLALLAIFTMALGIGATTATWSVIDGVLLRPLPFPASERLLEVWRWSGGGGGPFLTLDTLETLRETAASLEAVEGYVTDIVVADGAPPRTVRVARVTAGVLPALGVPPVHGRHLAAADGPDAVVLREDLWRQIGTGDWTSTNRPVGIDGRTYRVIGVMPATFRFPGADTQVWAPLDWDAEAPVTGGEQLHTLARRGRGVSQQQVAAELTAISRGLHEQGALRDEYTLVPEPLNPFESEMRSGIGGYRRIRSTLSLLFGAVTFVLLIACANTGNLMLMRAAQRARETAVRQALGASTVRVGGHFVVEALVLCVAAGVLGAGLAVVAVRAVAFRMPTLDYQDIGGAVVSPRAFLVVVVLSLATALVIGLVPALRASRRSVATDLAVLGATTGGRRRRLSGLLVVTEMALSLMLLAGAGLFVRSFVNLQRTDLGFDVDRLAFVGLRLPELRYEDGEARSRYVDELSARLLRLPGVEAAAMAASVPPEAGYFLAFGRMRFADDAGPQSTSDVFISSNLVAPGYFDTLGIPLLEGRPFTPGDAASAEAVAIVEAGSARRLWPDGSVIGRRFRPPHLDSWFTVVGVVGETRQVNADWPGGDLRYYVPFPPAQVQTEARLVVRTDAPETLLSAIRREAWAIDPRVAVLASTMERHVRDGQARPRFAVWLMTMFAGVGLLLAAGGILAVVSSDVGERTREVGIRMALGATPRDVVRLVLRRGAMLTAGGTALGLAGAWAATPLAESMLFEVAPLDPLSLLGATTVLAAVALAATWLPARRAAGVDPVDALRAE